MKSNTLKGLILSLTLGLFSASHVASAQNCDIIYVSTTGTGSGTMASPSSIQNAFTAAVPGTVIRLATGTYNIDNPIQLIDSIIVEGGFIQASSWTKTSMPGSTTINRTTLNPEGSAHAQRLVAFYGNNISDFRFQDLTITTANANQPGMSTYAMHLTSCSDYSIVRTQLLAGSAASGSNGTPGVGGNPGRNGGNGSAGDIDDEEDSGGGGGGGGGGGTSVGTPGGNASGNYNAANNCTIAGGTPGTGGLTAGNGGPGQGDTNGCGCCNAGTIGGAGASSTSSRSGGGGGGGANGGCEDQSGGAGGLGGGVSGVFGTNSSGGAAGGWGDPGGDGGNGGAGSNGLDGVVGALGSTGSHVGGYWIPGSQGATGTDGSGGQGGRGGGGGGGQYCTFCVDGCGSGGGGGGGGGQGGAGGTGGRGGGSSFALYLFNNGANGNIIQSRLQAGAPGAGGVGGNGGTGGTGGTGGSGSPYGGSEVGNGGNGGNGGSGGSGGQGGNGTAGVSMNIFASGTAVATNESAFNLAAQPVVQATHPICENASITFSGPVSSTWDFTPSASPQFASSASVDIVYTDGGFFDVTYSGNTYVGFSYIRDAEIADAGSDQHLCGVTTGSISATVPSTGTGTWTSLDGAGIDSPNSPSTGVTGLASGEYRFVWTVSTCCPDTWDTVSVFVGNETFGTDVVSACGPYLWIDGNTYNSDESAATHTLIGGAASGCDSTVTLNLTMNAHSTGTDVVSACGSYMWIDNQTYTSNNNTATFTIPNAAGCDSVVTLNLTINQATTGTDVVSACDSYLWIDGNTYNTNNSSATYTLQNAAGCDSVLTLNLTINQSTSSTQNHTALDSYTWPVNGQTYTSSGQYSAVIPNAAGCDSTITLNLTMNHTGLEELASIVKVYPNPATDFLKITSSEKLEGKYEIVDMKGKVYAQGEIKDGETEIRLDKLSAGSYYLRFAAYDESILFVKE